MADENYSLESNLPASIDIEEMIVGRFTSRQLIYLCIGAALFYDCAFKIPNRYIGVGLGVVIVIITYFLGFYKMKKYDMNLSDYIYYMLKYRQGQQLFLNKD